MPVEEHEGKYIHILRPKWDDLGFIGLIRVLCGVLVLIVIDIFFDLE